MQLQFPANKVAEIISLDTFPLRAKVGECVFVWGSEIEAAFEPPSPLEFAVE